VVRGEREVIVAPIEDRPGGLASLLAPLAAAGVNADLLYLATDSRVVIGVEDLERAQAALRPAAEGRCTMAVTARQLGPFAVRSTEILIAEGGEEHHTLKRAVGALDLTALGVGAIIGTGIFVVIGEGAGDAGPAVTVSFVLAALTCLFSALSYAELASSIPIAGSAYTYTYATLGEVIAWIIGWDLILEYGIAVAAVAVGWGGNLNEFLDTAFGIRIPDAVSTSPEQGGTFNFPPSSSSPP
jgi:Amino acid permease